MLVSAISANNPKVIINNNLPLNNSRSGENVSDTSFSFLSTKKSNQDNSITKTFGVINEWKAFCHEQILNGKLDVIA